MGGDSGDDDGVSVVMRRCEDDNIRLISFTDTARSGKVDDDEGGVNGNDEGGDDDDGNDEGGDVDDGVTDNGGSDDDGGVSDNDVGGGDNDGGGS